jgi:hypothetical protein
MINDLSLFVAASCCCPFACAPRFTFRVRVKTNGVSIQVEFCLKKLRHPTALHCPTQLIPSRIDDRRKVHQSSFASHPLSGESGVHSTPLPQLPLDLVVFQSDFNKSFDQRRAQQSPPKHASTCCLRVQVYGERYLFHIFV